MAAQVKTFISFLRKYPEMVGGSVVLIALYLISLYRYVLFHSLAEMFSIVIACGVFNTAQAKMIGRTPEECTGKECFRVFEKRDAVCPHCPGVRAMQTGLPAEVETGAVLDVNAG